MHITQSPRWRHGAHCLHCWVWKQLLRLCTFVVWLRQKFAISIWEITSQNKAYCKYTRWSRSVEVYFSFRKKGYLSQRVISFWSILSRTSGGDGQLYYRIIEGSGRKARSRTIAMARQSEGLAMGWWPGHRKGVEPKSVWEAGQRKNHRTYKNQLNMAFRE